MAGYVSSGMASLEKEMNIIKKSRKELPFFIRVATAQNHTVEIFFPYQWTEFDLRALEGMDPDKRKWISIPARDGEYSLEVASARLPDGNWLQVGLSTEDRQKVLNRFGEMFTGVFLLIASLGFLFGILMAFRALRPIQKMTQTVQSIIGGNMESRVSRTGAGDELDDLATLFNEMLDKIETLITAMKSSLENVGHDLRTPITRLQNKAERGLLGGDEAYYREALAGCLEEAERILRMLNTLMDISEAETGIMHLKKKQTHITHLTKEVAEFYQYVAEENRLFMHQNIQEELLANVDRDRVGQALANLMDNAVKYTLTGGQITINAVQQNREIVIQVEDTGIGIPDDAIPKIWDRLYRVDPSRSTTGLGLGLPQVKAIIEAHGGWIDVSSEAGEGSVFTIHLPIDR
ncbi:MAG: sensor histidine kinase [Thermodesulfobacteriota bacterium]